MTSAGLDRLMTDMGINPCEHKATITRQELVTEKRGPFLTVATMKVTKVCKYCGKEVK